MAVSVCASAQQIGNTQTNVLTFTQRMAAYENGQMTVDQVTDKPDWAKELLEYYQNNTNDVPIK